MVGTPENEQALIETARRGDIDAFNALVISYQDSVYTLAYRIMGDSHSAADAAQETFILAYRRLNTYRGGNFRSWLLRITTNTCYDELRRRKRRPATSLEELPGADMDDGPPLANESSTPEQIVQQNELNQAIQECINSLGEDQRMVLVLSDVEGLSYQEIADNTGAQLGTIKSRLSRARTSVRQCLQAVQELLPSAYRLIGNDEDTM
jgi:RNA polymerase sigma-70 factor (ECF subfamily)